MTPRLAELLLLGAGSISSAHRVLSRRGLCAAFGTFATAGVSLPAAATSVESNGVAFTFTESSLGLELATSSTGRVRIERIKPNSPAIPKGVPPLATILEVNGVDATSLPVEQVQSLIRGASRPLTLRLDVSEFRALPAVAQTEAAAAALGMATDRIQIDLITGPQDPSCGYKTRASDVVEVEFAARVVGGGEFDSSERRSGRPFAFLLGNGDVSRGLELGTLEMCIGEERRVTVPPQLGFGRRGNKVFGVPPDATLEYRIKLVSINMTTDPRVRRADVADEQRFSEDNEGNVVNAATLP